MSVRRGVRGGGAGRGGSEYAEYFEYFEYWHGGTVVECDVYDVCVGDHGDDQHACTSGDAR